MRTLPVEDEPEMSRLIAPSVGATGLIVDSVTSIAGAALTIGGHALVLLDRQPPNGDGLTLLPSLRTASPGTPVIVLTALDDGRDKICASTTRSSPTHSTPRLSPVRARLAVARVTIHPVRGVGYMPGEA